ncbi:hypothetical protein EON80_00160 [bacterium]|nr:MAG: hypothetical protein EON80_00160 [bacterium]
MAEEFVDLYEVLELPVDADRNVLRKRINELYLDAQRNLDHRTFATRVKYQELFEVTMPQARYILLDDGRRDEYDRLVHAYRSAKNGTPVPPSAPQPTPAPKVEVNPNDALPGESPRVEPLPATPVDPEQLAREREELWKKWKSGLEDALSTETETRPKPRAATSSPSSFSLQPEAPAPASASAQPQAIQAKIQPAPAAPAPAPAAPTPAPKAAARPKVDISFDFEKKEAAAAPEGAGSGWVDTGTSDMELNLAEIEQRRTDHRRQIMKDILVNVGLIWGTIGALIIFVPGFFGLVNTMGRYYPRNAAPLLKYNPNLLWGVGLTLIVVASYFASRELSKTMRRKKAQEFSFLSYEDLLKRVKKG